MSDNNLTNVIDIKLSPDIEKIISRVYKKNKNLNILLYEPKCTVIATIKQDYTAFRKELGKLLKEKKVHDEDSKRILNLIDDNSELLYTENDDNSIAKIKNSEENASNDKVALQNDLNDLNDHIEIKNVNVLDCLRLDSGNARVTGRLVGRSEPYKVVSAITTSCNCKSEPLTKLFNPPKFALKEFMCHQCHSKIKTISTIYTNAVTLILQDTETLDGTDYLTCVLLDFNVRNIKVGEKVLLTGEIHIKPKSNKESLVPIVFTNSLEYVDWNEIKVTDEDIDSIRSFASKENDSKIIESLVEIFDESIIGNDIVKEALLYSLVNVGDDLDSIKKHKRRKRINVLLAGDPGQAKSLLIKRASSLIPNSRCESVQHSSGKSLTALVTVENDQSFLRLGPISLSGGRICGLNEIGTMIPEDQNYLLDIMEEGEYTFNKKGISAKIESPTTIIATTNLNDSYTYTGSRSLNESFDKTSLSQIPLQRPLLDRFDLIIILKDICDIEALREYAEKKIESQSDVIPDQFNFLQKYVEYARKLNPIFSPESNQMIIDYYVNLRRTNPDLKSKRVLDSIFRLCTAVSKLKLKDVVDSDDVTHAIRFYNTLVNKYLDPVNIIPQDPAKLVIECCKEILKDNINNGATATAFSEVIEQVCTENERCRSYLLGSSRTINNEENINRLTTLSNNKKLRKISELIRNDKDIILVNKNPITLSYNFNNVPPKGNQRDLQSFRSQESFKSPGHSKLDEFENDVSTPLSTITDTFSSSYNETDN